MKLFHLLFLLSVCSNVFAFDITLLQNNKEAYSNIVGKKPSNQVRIWLENQNQSDLKSRINQFLKDTMLFHSQNGQCELKLVQILKDKANYYHLISEENEIYHLLSYLRLENYIDDIFLKILQRLLEVDDQLAEVDSNRILRPFNALTDETSGIDTTKVYSAFKKYPDEKSECVISSWRSIVYQLGWSHRRNRNVLLKKLNFLAYNNQDLDLKTYKSLEVLRSLEIIDWDINLNQYLDIVKNAKDKLQTSNNSGTTSSDISSTLISRKEKITQRERLYRTYNSTQIMMLTDIINKTSRRMDAKRISINIENSDMPSESEIYVLSPMERYRLSLKMLKKDMAETMRSELFQGKKIEYEDLVSASFETGLIKAQDLEMILKFEEFWNPQVPRWKMYAGFAFQMAGSASFFLPPPFNIFGALALAITQSKVVNQDQKPDVDENWNVII